MTHVISPVQSTADWQYFTQAIAQLQHALEEFVRLRTHPESNIESLDELFDLPPLPPGSPPPRFLRFCQRFGLSTLERYILLLCAGAELSRIIPTLCGAIAGDPQRLYVTFGLVLTLFPIKSWEAFHPDAPLRRWRLIEVGGGNILTASPLRIDERILHDLLGGHHLDSRLWGIVVEDQPGSDLACPLPPSQQQIAHQAATLLQASHSPAVVQLCGGDGTSQRAIAAAACALAGRGMRIVAAAALPTDTDAFNLIQCLCEREARLTDSVLVLDCDRPAEAVPASEVAPASGSGAIARFIEETRCPLVLMSRDRLPARQRSLITFDVPSLSSEEQRTLWQHTLGEQAAQLNGHIETLVAYFNLSAPAIRSACEGALGGAEASPAPLPQALWQACLTQARPRLADLAQFIEATASWEDLVLPDKEKGLLQTIAAHVRQRAIVYEQWGFAQKSRRGLGISALFAGASGTGKTMAAEVLARELNLNLYRIDLSSVVSKYIGETEKNLRRIFDAAEAGGAILLFDEADALFGKRSEVKDSHDRYANMEVSYLLQRIEAYRGLAILTTNLKSALDQAFLRRIRFIVQFPFPDATQRAEIWRRIFPQQTPTQNLAYDKLARLQVAGGNIRNIALNAAFLAADEGEPVQMKHLLLAAQTEYIKLERPLTDEEVKGWVRKET